MQILTKNTAGQKVIMLGYSRTDFSPIVSNGSIRGSISKDGGASVFLTSDSPGEIGGGLYYFTLTQAETNADLIAITAVSDDSDCVLEPLAITTGAAIPDVNVAQISGDSTAADNLELDYDGTGFAKGNSSIGTITATGIDGYTIAQALKILLSFTVGRASGAGGSTLRFRDLLDTTNRITMAVDASGNRSSITLSVS